MTTATGLFLREEEPTLHVHIYGRARDEKFQEFGQALHLSHPSTGFYDGFERLSEGDVTALGMRITELSASTVCDEWALGSTTPALAVESPA